MYLCLVGLLNMNYKNLIVKYLITLITLILLVGVIKGAPTLSGTLRYQYEKDGSVGGPFETSNSNSRYSLVEAIVNDKSFYLSEELAKFASPDLTRVGDKFITIFTPGVSFIAAPFYVLGKAIGMPQLITYLSTAFLALLNAYLVSLLSRRLGATAMASYLAGFLFLFGTNALPYALTLTQHHAGIFVLLLSVINIFAPRTFFRNIALGALFGAGLLMDIPNGFILLPVILYALSQHIKRDTIGESIKIKIKLSIVGLIVGLLPLLALFAWYNYQTTGSSTKIGQTIGRYDFPVEGDIQEKVSRLEGTKDRKLIPYETRNLLSGLYTLLISDERGWAYYSPVVLFGMLGMAIAYRERRNEGLLATIAASVGVTLLTYAMFGDPWGGWSFGPRYLLPATALVSAGIALGIDRYKNQIIFGIVFVATAIYSIAVNVLGALTTNAIPPRVEAINLLEPIPYTYTYNLDLLLNKEVSSSLVYNVWFSNKLPAFQYYLTIASIVCLIFIALYITSVITIKKKS